MPRKSVRCWLPVCRMRPVSLTTFWTASDSATVSVSGFSQ